MKNIKILVIFGLMTFVGTFSANAQDALSSDTEVEARLIAPLGFAQQNNLNFGTIAKTGTTAGTVRIKPKTAGERVFSSSYTTVGAGTREAPTSAPIYKITGEEDMTYKLTLPQDVSVELENSDGLLLNNMTVDNFTYVLESTALSGGVYTPETLTMGTTGNTLTIGDSEEKNTYHIGATLNIQASQVLGVYEGSYAVTVQYD